MFNLLLILQFFDYSNLEIPSVGNSRVQILLMEDLELQTYAVTPGSRSPPLNSFGRNFNGGQA